jgi:hypothetical protein
MSSGQVIQNNEYKNDHLAMHGGTCLNSSYSKGRNCEGYGLRPTQAKC